MKNRSLRQFEDHRAFSAAAAQHIALMAAEAAAARGQFLLALAGGGTPSDAYALLGQAPLAAHFPWEKTILFWGDERLVPPDDPGSSFGQVNDLFLHRVPVPSSQICRIKGELNPAKALADYKEQLKRYAEPGRIWPRLDLALLGMGRDGHTASLFPGPERSEETREPVVAVTAQYDGRPAARISMTPLVLNDARHIMFMVTGADKATTLQAVLFGPSQPERYPAQRILPVDGDIIWFVDQAAASQLQPKA